jgi:hypothetical protein
MFRRLQKERIPLANAVLGEIEEGDFSSSPHQTNKSKEIQYHCTRYH